MILPERRKKRSISVSASDVYPNDTNTPFGLSSRIRTASNLSISGRPTFAICFTWIGYQLPRTSNSGGSVSLRSCARGEAPSGNTRPSMPKSPTLTLFGMPPSAITAQFSNSNGGSLRSRSGVHGRSRTTNARRPACHRVSSCVSRHSSRSRFATTRHAVGEISMPIHCRPNVSAAWIAVPQPQKASRTNHRPPASVLLSSAILV